MQIMPNLLQIPVAQGPHKTSEVWAILGDTVATQVRCTLIHTCPLRESVI